MSQPCIIIITGLPGTGKTTLGKRLSENLAVPFFYKDLFKEIMFDRIGWSDRAWSQKVDKAAYDMLYAIVESFAQVKKSAIIESNFPAHHATPRLRALQKTYRFLPIQVRCITQGDILLERFTQRAHSPHRHPGHLDKESVEKEWAPILRTGVIAPLDLGMPIIDVDTTDFDAVDYDAITQRVSARMQSAS